MIPTKYQGADPEPVLYLFMRTDMDSMNPGKGMAQAAHGANAMVKRIRAISERASKTGGGGSYVKHLLNVWEEQGKGFGTTIVLSGGDLSGIAGIIEEDMKTDCHLRQWMSGEVLDETYPIRDGQVTHFLPIHTCTWLLCDTDDDKFEHYLGEFQLHD